MTTLKLEEGGLRAVDDTLSEEITLEAWRAGARPVGAEAALILPNEASTEEFADVVREFDVVVVEFPKFGDGRAYSQAVALRTRLNFDGEIRARGDVLCDQALFMARCGIDVFEIGGGDIDGFRRALRAFSAFYQASADKMTPVWRIRSRDRARRRAA